MTLTITQEGVPLADALVSLVDPNIPFSVGGTTDTNGTVVLYTHGKHKGAPLGKYKVCLVKTESDPVPPAPSMSAPEFEAYQKERQKNPPKTYSLVEKQYTQTETTPLELDISGAMTKTLDAGKAIKDVL